MILAGDVGGTKVHLALYEFQRGTLNHLREGKYPAQHYDNLEAVVHEFLAAGGEPAKDLNAACFGVPGPVRGGRLKLTNLPWTLDSRELSKTLGIEHIFLINDLEANGYGIPELAADQIEVLHPGDPQAVGNRGLLAAGTGLGEAMLIWDGKTHTPYPSEGGHGDFAARNSIEIELLQYLLGQFGGHVSTERVVSGIGLKNVYCFLRDAKKMDEPKWLRERMATEDPNAVIGELGESGASELCAETLNIFVSAYGAETGNLALKVLANGGMYLGGGIAPKIIAKLREGAFMQAFLAKGRMSGLLEHMPVRIILESRAALMGAAAYAEARAAEFSGQSERAASSRSS